jgi:hypothetical protein
LIRILLELFYAEEAFYCVCFGPLGLATLLIVSYYVVWWWLRTRSSVEPERVQRHRAVAGPLILQVTLLSFVVAPIYFFLEFTVIDHLAWSQTVKDREILVQAIENFEARTGEYPATLDDLVPFELARVPNVPGRGPYSYNSGDGWYHLSYVISSGAAPVFCNYGTGYLGWHCD